MAFDIKFLADVSNFIRGTDNVADALEDIGDDLKDVAKDSDKALDSVGKDLQGVTDDAKDMDKKVSQAFKNMSEDARKAGKDTGTSVKDGTDKAKEGFSELKDESASTAREAAASFSSIEDAADSLQEIAANAFVGFGPAGMAAGLVAAAGIGLAISALQDNADKINENKEKMLGLAQVMKENGGKLSMADNIQAMDDYGYSIQDTKEWFEIFQEDAVSGFEELRDGAQKAGVTVKDAFLGQFGSAEDAQRVLSSLEAEMRDLEGQTKEVANTYSEFGGTIDLTDPSIRKQIEGNKELTDKVREHIKELEAAAEIERIRREAIEGTVEAILEDVAALEKRNGLIQDGVTSELDYLDAVAETSATIEENGLTLDKNTEAGRENQRALIEQSNAALDMATSQLQAGTSADTVAASLAAQREALLLQLDAMTGSRAESEKLAEAMGLIPTEVITEVKTNGAVESKTEIESIPATKDSQVNVDDGGTAAATQGRVNAVTGKDVKIDVQDFRTVEQTQNRIDGLKGKDVKIDVQDFNTVSQTQTRIDGLHGKDVDITVRLTNLQAIRDELALLTLPRTAYVDIVQRKGQEAP
jgi:hypothetical protein